LKSRSPDYEKALLKQLTEGFEPAFRELYHDYSPGVYRIARRYVQSPDLAEDIVQEIFLTLWGRRMEMSGILSFRHYIFSMTRNLCLRHLKEIAEDVRVHEEFSERLELYDEDTLGNYREQLYEAVGSLPPQQRQVFEMAKLQGMSHETIARKLNLSTSTVNNHITSALKLLRRRLRSSPIGWSGLLLFWFY